MSNRSWLGEHSKGWPIWSDVYDLWEKAEVPEVIRFLTRLIESELAPDWTPLKR